MGVIMARKMVSFRLPTIALDMLAKLASRHDCSQADIVNALIQWQFTKDFGGDLGNFYKILEMVK